VIGYVFIDRNIQDGRIIEAREDLMNGYHIVPEPAQFINNRPARTFIDHGFHNAGSVSTSGTTSSLLRIASA
jgi:hypothetical protein